MEGTVVDQRNSIWEIRFSGQLLRDKGWHIWKCCHRWRRRWLSSWPWETPMANTEQREQTAQQICFPRQNPVAYPPWLALTGARTWACLAAWVSKALSTSICTQPPYRATLGRQLNSMCVFHPAVFTLILTLSLPLSLWSSPSTTLHLCLVSFILYSVSGN